MARISEDVIDHRGDAGLADGAAEGLVRETRALASLPLEARRVLWHRSWDRLLEPLTASLAIPARSGPDPEDADSVRKEQG